MKIKSTPSETAGEQTSETPLTPTTLPTTTPTPETSANLTVVPNANAVDDRRFPDTMSEEEEERRWKELDKRVSEAGPLMSKRLTRDYFKAKEQFARLMAVKLTPEVMGVNLVETSEILQDGIRIAGEALEQSKTTKEKVDALMAITLATRAQGELVVKMSKLYRAGEKIINTPRQRINQAKAPSADIPFNIVAERVEINTQDRAKNDTAEEG